jgi:DNA-binding XRE family transcriptional regulator
MTQEDLADSAEIGLTTVQSMERGLMQYGIVGFA